MDTKQLEKRIADLENRMKNHFHEGSDTPKIEGLKKLYPINPLIPQPNITKPSGGITVDSEARTAIDAIIDLLDLLGITL